MENNTSWNRILWSVDAFPEDTAIYKKCIEVVSVLSKTLAPATFTPVYGLVPNDVGATEASMGRGWVSTYRTSAEKSLGDRLKSLKIPGLQPAKIIEAPSFTLRDAVQAVHDEGKKMQADLIVLGTHGRKGLQRLFLGSFAETLLIQSSIPLLVVKKTPGKISAFRNVFFPTDFSAASESGFERVIALAARLKAKVTLFYQIPNPVEPLIQSGMILLGGNWVPVRQYFSDENEKREAQAQAWVERAKVRGVKVTSIISRQSKPTSDEILKAAKKSKADLIAMVSQSSRISTVMIGSVTRQVIRGADCPVLAIHARG